VRSVLLDHLVGAGEQCRGHVEAERFRILEADNQFNLGDLPGRQAALENSARVNS
jgi:hypothetical protein